MRVIVDEAAWNDLDKIGSWIAKDNPEAAQRELAKIAHVIRQLGRFPGGRVSLLARPTSSYSNWGETGSCSGHRRSAWRAKPREATLNLRRIT